MMAVPRLNISSEQAEERSSNRGSVVSMISNYIRRFPSPVPFPPEALLSPSSREYSSHPSPSGVDIALPDISRDGRSETPESCTATLTAGRDSPSNPDGTVLGVGITEDPESIPDSGEPPSAPQSVDELSVLPGMVEYTHERRYELPTYGYPKEDYQEIPRCNAIPRRTQPTGNWQVHVHPEGNPYFRSDEFYTYAWAYDQSVQQYLNYAVTFLRDEKQYHYDVNWKDVEICLELFPATGDEPPYISFYLCDMVKREVFTLSRMSDDTVLGYMAAVRVQSREHLDLAVESLYWKHIFMFPHGRKFSKETVRRLSAEIHWYMLDKELSPASTAPYSADDLSRFQQIVKDIDVAPDEDMFPEDVAVIGRLKTFLVGDRFMRLHGEPCAQLDVTKSITQEVHILEWWFTLWAWLFFLIPFTYFDNLRKAWVDKKINYQVWRRFIGELQEDWTASITPSAVILATNISFLAIQTVDDGGQFSPHRSAAQILCYISTLFSLGNIVACTVLARQHRPCLHHHAQDAAEYLTARIVSSGHMQYLAIVYTIPTAFFLWALVTFTIAVFWVCLHATDTWTRATISAGLVISVFLLVVVIRNGNWQPFEMTNVKERMQKRLQETKEHARKMTRKVSENLVRSLSLPRRAMTRAAARSWSTFSAGSSGNRTKVSNSVPV